MNYKISEFVDRIGNVRMKDVFNPFFDRCDVYDLQNAATLRKGNLKRSLVAAVEQNVDHIWIARDLGYRGGRRTGLALTDEFHLAAYSSMLRGLQFDRATTGLPVAERTAKTIWHMLLQTNEPTFLWNVFPFHPYINGSQFTNRPHTSREREQCSPFLFEILEIVSPKKIIAIGGDAHKMMQKLGIESMNVRHPSYGGNKLFSEQIRNIYNI